MWIVSNLATRETGINLVNVNEKYRVVHPATLNLTYWRYVTSRGKQTKKTSTMPKCCLHGNLQLKSYWQLCSTTLWTIIILTPVFLEIWEKQKGANFKVFVLHPDSLKKYIYATWTCILLIETNNIRVYFILTSFFILFYCKLGSSVVQEMALQGSGIFTDLYGNIFWLMSANDFQGKNVVTMFDGVQRRVA